MDPAIVGKFSTDKLEKIQTTLYLSDYQITNYNEAHSIIATVTDLKLNIKAINVKSAKGKLYYLLIGQKAIN